MREIRDANIHGRQKAVECGARKDLAWRMMMKNERQLDVKGDDFSISRRWEDRRDKRRTRSGARSSLRVGKDKLDPRLHFREAVLMHCCFRWHWLRTHFTVLENRWLLGTLFPRGGGCSRSPWHSNNNRSATFEKGNFSMYFADKSDPYLTPFFKVFFKNVWKEQCQDSSLSVQRLGYQWPLALLMISNHDGAKTRMTTSWPNLIKRNETNHGGVR